MSRWSVVVGTVLWAVVLTWLLILRSGTESGSEDRPTDGASTAADASVDGGSGDGEQAASGKSGATAADSSQGGPPTITLNMAPPTIPDFSFEECMGGTFGLEDLKGRPWVASFVFTRCVLTCPQITLAMKKLHDRVIEENPDVMFVTFTVDAEYDTADVLRKYSEAYEPDRSRWKFLTGDAEAIRQFIVSGFGVYVKENIGESRRPGLEVAHSNRVVLVDPEGAPVGKFLATNDAEMARLARILLGRAPFPEPSPPVRFLPPGSGPEGVEIEIRGQDSSFESAGPSAADDGGPTDVRGDARAATDDFRRHSPAERAARIDRLLPGWARRLPTVNALLSATATVLLLSGWRAIRRGRRVRHRNFMVAAFAVSVLFLGCYLTSHWALQHYASERGRPFTGGEPAARLYYAILWPHVVLAAAVPFLAVRVFMHAFAQRWDRHRRLARWTLPVWLYVSVTGVIIYWMLYGGAF